MVIRVQAWHMYMHDVRADKRVARTHTCIYMHSTLALQNTRRYMGRYMGQGSPSHGHYQASCLHTSTPTHISLHFSTNRHKPHLTTQPCLATCPKASHRTPKTLTTTECPDTQPPAATQTQPKLSPSTKPGYTQPQTRIPPSPKPRIPPSPKTLNTIQPQTPATTQPQTPAHNPAPKPN